MCMRSSSLYNRTCRNKSYSPLYKELEAVPCPLAATDMFEVMEQARKERSQTQATMLKKTLMKKVISRCRKVAQLNGELVLGADILQDVVDKVISLSEQEPCGVRGGTLVVSFSPVTNVTGNPLQIGKFPMDSGTVPTFELHLTLQASTAVAERIKRSLTNMIRRMGGRPQQIKIDPKFTMTKKKLYRSSTSN